MEEELLSRQLPHALEAEQAVLGAMLIDSRCVPEVIGMLRPDDFFLQQNKDIYETIYTMFNYSETIDPVTVLNKLKERGLGDEKLASYLMQLMEITPTAANVGQYAEIVRDKAIMRNLAVAAGDIRETVFEGVGTAAEILESAEKKIFALRNGNSGDSLQHMVLVNVFERLDELSQSDQAFPGISTGLMDLDKKINGLNKSDLVLIAARPGMGKTSIALNIALAAAKKTDKTVAFFSLEMSREQLAMRLLANESFVDLSKLITGKLDEEDWMKVGIASSALSQTDIRVDDNPSISVAEMNAKCRRLDNLGLVLIDYLQLMTSAGKGQTSNNANRVQVVSDISRALKIMAKELNVPVICLSQLSRANESRTDKRPMLSDLRESGAIEQDADEVMFIYRDDYYNPNSEEKNVAEIIVAKNRHGETGTVKVQWLPQFTTFADREWKHSDG